PHLPPETTIFGIPPGAPLPDPESNDYILRSEVVGNSPELFNNQPRTTRMITVSGKRVIFQRGHPNGLFDYSDNDDIQEMNIHAETLIIRSALRLPETRVSIYARELRFEDVSGPSEFASVSTTPRSITTRPNQFQDGSPG